MYNTSTRVGIQNTAPSGSGIPKDSKTLNDHSNTFVFKPIFGLYLARITNLNSSSVGVILALGSFPPNACLDAHSILNNVVALYLIAHICQGLNWYGSIKKVSLANEKRQILFEILIQTVNDSFIHDN